MIPIKNYENYLIDKNGDIFSLFKKRKLKTFNNCGYERIALVNKNGRNKFLLHRLLAEAYLPNPNNKPLINHINGIRNDNRLENLEWCTYSENIKHAHDIGLCENQHKICGLIGKRTIKFAQNASKKLVLDTQTGIFYESCREASNLLGIKYHNLVQYLSGINKNKTSLIYV